MEREKTDRCVNMYLRLVIRRIIGCGVVKSSEGHVKLIFVVVGGAVEIKPIC